MEASDNSSSILRPGHPWGSLHDLDWERADPRLWARLTRTPTAQLSTNEVAQVLGSFPLFAERCLVVKERPDPSRPEKETRLVPFRMNAAQRRFLREMTGRDIVLKARQLGFSSVIIAYYFYLTITRPNTVTAIVSHEAKSSEALMKMVHLLYEHLPAEFRMTTKYSSKYEMTFPEVNSSIFIMTAGSPDQARGMTITNLHCSEVALWKESEALVAALFAAGPPRRIIIETTARGIGGWFYDFWHRAKAARVPFAPHFYDWRLEPLYRIKLGRGESITAEPGLDVEQTKFAMEKRALHKELFAQEYPMNDVECFVGTSRSVFDTQALMAYLKVCAEPRWRGNFQKDGRFYTARDGAVRIWAAPKRDRNYVIGADVAEGLEKGDYSCAVVYDTTAQDIVAEWHGHIDPDLFADELAAIGYYYGGLSGAALLAVERNNHGGTTLNALRHLHYPRIFYQRSIDKRNNRVTENLGWLTDIHSKPYAIDALSAMVREGKIGLPSKEVVEEMLRFIHLSPTNGSIMGAETGCYDDRVMATAIAVASVQYQPVARPPAHVQAITDPWRRAEAKRKQKAQYMGLDEEQGLDQAAFGL